MSTHDRLRCLARSGRGQTLSEYAVSLTVIALLVAIGLQLMSSSITSELQTAVGIL